MLWGGKCCRQRCHVTPSLSLSLSRSRGNKLWERGVKPGPRTADFVSEGMWWWKWINFWMGYDVATTAAIPPILVSEAVGRQLHLRARRCGLHVHNSN